MNTCTHQQYRREDGCFLVSRSWVTFLNPGLHSSSETGVNLGIWSWKKSLIWISLMLERHYWYQFYEEVKSWDSTTWLIIGQIQISGSKRYLQLHLLSERFVFLIVTARVFRKMESRRMSWYQRRLFSCQIVSCLHIYSLCVCSTAADYTSCLCSTLAEALREKRRGGNK
jgi:hypothetical protein